MVFRVILFVWGFLLDMAAISRMTDDEKDLVIPLLRQHLHTAERKPKRSSRVPRWQMAADRKARGKQ
jgi:hypothetical protein